MIVRETKNRNPSEKGENPWTKTGIEVSLGITVPQGEGAHIEE